mmetsp:Transcript_30039/g.73173  ORF Transcript_30039/g.73173 Transcript_30039/m.73173 type:complete len:106 (+) Transcript_30039:57-374(+)
MESARHFVLVSVSRLPRAKAPSACASVDWYCIGPRCRYNHAVIVDVPRLALLVSAGVALRHGGTHAIVWSVRQDDGHGRRRRVGVRCRLLRAGDVLALIDDGCVR